MTTVDDEAGSAVAGTPQRVGATPVDAAEARALTRAFLDLHVPAAPERLVIDVLLVVSELVTNALRHAGGLTVFQLSAGPGAVEISVRDASSRLPAFNGAGPGRLPGGYGWPLVHRLAEVAVVPLADGKLIRATVAF